MGSAYKIKHGLVVGDNVLNVSNGDRLALYNGIEIATSASIAEANNVIINKILSGVLQAAPKAQNIVTLDQTSILRTTIFSDPGNVTYDINTDFYVQATLIGQNFELNFQTNELAYGSYISFTDLLGTFNAYPITVTIVNQPLEGVAAPNIIVLDVANTITKFIYVDATYGWKRVTLLNQ